MVSYSLGISQDTFVTLEPGFTTWDRLVPSRKLPPTYTSLPLCIAVFRAGPALPGLRWWLTDNTIYAVGTVSRPSGCPQHVGSTLPPGCLVVPFSQDSFLCLVSGGSSTNATRDLVLPRDFSVVFSFLDTTTVPADTTRYT